MANISGRFTPVYLSGLLLLSAGITACGGSSSSSPEATPDDQVNSTGIENPISNDNSNTNQTTTGSDNFIVLESNGIMVELPAPNESMIDYDLIEVVNGTLWPELHYRVTNNSENTIVAPKCDVVAFKDGAQVQSTFASVTHELRSGDTTLDRVDLTRLEDISEVDTNKFMDCVSEEVVDFTDNPLLVVELIEYKTDEDGDVVVVAQMTNNSDRVIFGPICSLLIRQGNEVLQGVFIQFEDGDDEPGFGFGGPFISETPIRSELEEFDSDEFDRDDLFCGFIASL